MELKSLGYRTDLALLQLGGTRVEDRSDCFVVRSPHKPDPLVGDFLLLALVPAPDACGRWLDRFAAAFPAAGHVAIGFDGTDGAAADLGWFSEHGFTAEAQTVMTAGAVHEPARRNTSTAYRALETDGDWAQSVELQMRCNDRLEPTAYRAYVSVNAATNRSLVERGHGEWFGAFVDGRLVAQLGLLAAGGDVRASGRLRPIRTTGIRDSPRHWCIKPAVMGSTRCAPIPWSWSLTRTTGGEMSISEGVRGR